jgi:methylglyoxal synthase
MKSRLNIALVSHDARKKELLEWVAFNSKVLSNHNLIATGTTGTLVEKLGEGLSLNDKVLRSGVPLKVTKVKSGPLGGDQKIGSMISDGEVDALIFFCDNLITQGHQTDISALTRLASLYNIPFATNRTTADMIISSPLLSDPDYEPIPTDFSGYVNRKVL